MHSEVLVTPSERIDCIVYLHVHCENAYMGALRGQK